MNRDQRVLDVGRENHDRSAEPAERSRDEDAEIAHPGNVDAHTGSGLRMLSAGTHPQPERRLVHDKPGYEHHRNRDIEGRIHLVEEHAAEHGNLAQAGHAEFLNAVGKGARPLLMEDNLTEIYGEPAGENVERGSRNDLIRLEIDARDGVERAENDTCQEPGEQSVPGRRRR